MTTSRRALALLTGLGIGAVPRWPGAVPARRPTRPRTTTPTSVVPIPKPTNAAGPTNADQDYPPAPDRQRLAK